VAVFEQLGADATLHIRFCSIWLSLVIQLPCYCYLLLPTC
jgi:hypothetical protein